MFIMAFMALPGRASAVTGDTNAQAVQKAVNYLAPSVSQWTIDQGCIACHHQGSALYGLSLAKASGFTVDMSANMGAPFIAQAIVNDQDAGGSWLWGGPQKLKSSYNLYGLAGYDAYVSTAYSNNLVAGADWALTSQSADGRWVMDFEDGDTAHGDMTTTARFMVGIAQAIQRVDASKAATYQTAMTKAVNYIKAHKADSNNVSGTGIVYEAAWAIIGLKAAGLADTDPDVQALVTDLLARKSNLGYAWGYAPGNGPDLFNSGMAIYALCTAGVPAVGNPALIQSLTWVNNQQGSNGTWGSDINTTFATLGLACYGDYGVILKNAGAITTVISSASPNPQTITYDFDLQNHGIIDDTYNLTVVGGMPGWTASIPSPVVVAAGVHTTVTLTVNAPANLPQALPVQMAVVATSQAVSSLTSSARITTFTDPPPPTSGDSTAVTLTGGNGGSVPKGQVIQLKATVKDTTTNTPAVGPGKGVVTFFVAGLAIGTDTDADGDGVFSFNFTPDCGWTATGAQDFRAIYSGIDLPAGQTDLLSSFKAGSLTVTVPACCASPETCDGKDNDCDGVIDNGFNVGAACANGVGQCSHAGAIQCVAGGQSACNAVPSAPSAETCDGLDNDCDGVVDNGNPGAGAACNTQLSGICGAGSTTCSAGALSCVPAFLPGAVAESCNGLDDNCDGVVDNGFNVGSACSNGVGACSAPGVFVCKPDGTATCNAVPGAPSAEVCGDQVDSDCDGATDNGCACLKDSSCGAPQGGQICDMGPGATYTCVAGCRQGSNGCGAGLHCTSSNTSVGACVACLADADCGGATSGIICDTHVHACVLGCRGAGGNGCSASLVCDSTDSTAGTCLACLDDRDCGGQNSGTVCETTTHTCQAGCRASNGNGCAGSLVCTSTDTAIGACVGCLDDSTCGSEKSGSVCDTSKQACVAGCRGQDGNGCSGNLVCTSKDSAIGACAGCMVDGDCGGPSSGTICDAASKECVLGCRGSEGNRCSGNLVCTSTDGGAGSCVGCMSDLDCGDAASGIVCEASSKQCMVGCRGSDGNGCSGNLVCTSKDVTIGSCAACLGDSDCGGAKSGIVCDQATLSCVVGCRGSDGNGCSGSLICTSTDGSFGKCAGCTHDSDCGGAASGAICDAASNTCTSGCRGEGGNACAAGKLCTSADTVVGACVECILDSDCGGAKSGKVCDKLACHDGCRGAFGNACRDGQTCSSATDAVGTCGPSYSDATSGSTSSSGGNSTGSSGAGGTDSSGATTGSGPGDSTSSAAGSGGSSGTGQPATYVGKTTGLMCSTQAGNDTGSLGWILGSALAALVSFRRRRSA
jgi:hypothetical protein